ncbi:MAG: M2 family metallopeptidase [Bacteriovoracaceae bacterium]|nr:M2 family metallopeptidase [Bacteriovoracaceae bacterium]
MKMRLGLVFLLISILSCTKKENITGFTSRVNQEYKELGEELSKAAWVNATYLTDDTDFLSSKASEKELSYTNKVVKEAARFKDIPPHEGEGRMVYLLRNSVTLVAPSETSKQKELAEITTKMQALYGKGKYCKTPEQCKNLDELSDILAKSKNYDELLDAWQGWRTISPPLKDMYARFVELSNEGAQEIGFKNTAELWQARYDMPADQFVQEVDRLWLQVKPLYESLHCYVRSHLSKVFAGKVTDVGPMPAHILGNMWSQQWGNVYKYVEPYKGVSSIDITKLLQQKKYDALKMVKTAESFFTSLGFENLPKSFYEKSMFLRPRDREVVCHASAWDMNAGAGDLRIKMCIKIDEEDFTTIHHELGHIFYYQSYAHQPVIFQTGANDGFHEAIGDAIALSINPTYLKKIGLLSQFTTNEKALINEQMKNALEKIAFLPFGRLMDQWRYDVFSGKVTAKEYNTHWWKLVKEYQGLVPAVERGEEFFDAGSKYHIPANTPYMRYFLSFILQFQFHKSLCALSGHTGPLHECSIYESKTAGKAFKEMLSLGASKPWPETLKTLTGTDKMDASALMEYFAPLEKWLGEQNKDKKCGW